MRKTCAALLIILVSVTALAQSESPPAVDLNGTAWMGAVKINENGDPDPKGSIEAVYYAVFGQDSERVWGCLLSFDIDESGKVPTLVPLTVPMTNGTQKGKKFSFDVIDLDDPDAADKDKFVGRVKNDDFIKAKYIPVDGKKVRVKLYRVNKDNYYSGVYFGKVWEQGTSKPKNSNIVFSMIEQNGKITDGSAIFSFPGDDEATILQGITGDIDLQTGAFTYEDKDQNIASQGTIADGKMEVDAVVNNLQYYAELYNFDDRKMKAPKLKKAPDPLEIPRGTTTMVTFNKAKYLTAAPFIDMQRGNVAVGYIPAIYIDRYYVDGKKLYVWITVGEYTTGFFQIEVKNPSGEAALSERVYIEDF